MSMKYKRRKFIIFTFLAITLMFFHVLSLTPPQDISRPFEAPIEIGNREDPRERRKEAKEGILDEMMKTFYKIFSLDYSLKPCLVSTHVLSKFYLRE